LEFNYLDNFICLFLEQQSLVSAFKEHDPQAKDVIALPTPITQLIPPIEPLGVFESCFPLKNGTPRQGILAPDSQGKLRIRPYRNTRPADVLEGLEQYSHVWIVFWFHGNFNKHCRAKVAPPRLNGDTVGVLATRSPHRLVPIGMTAAKLLRIENGDTLVLGGIDLIDGTPVLDVKPYVPKYDSIPDAKYPDWIVVENQFKEVIFTDRAKEQLQDLSSNLKILKDYDQALSTIRQALILDPRSVYRKQKFEKEAFGFHIDSLNIQCFIEDNVATIYNIEPGDQESDTQPEDVGVARETKQ